MTRSDRAIERLLTEAHAASGPSPKERLRALQRLETAIGLAPVVPPGDLPSRQSGRVSSSTTVSQVASGGGASVIKWSAVLVLALAAGEATRIGFRHDSPEARVGSDATLLAPGSGVPHVAPSPAVAPAAAPARPVDIPAAGTAREPVAPVALRSALPRGEPPPGVARSKASVDAVALPEAPDLHEALRWLRRAQAALRTEDGRGALSMLDELARRAPDVLLEEREVTRALAFCATGDESAARRVALRVRASWPLSPYAHRLSQSCVGPEPPSTQLLEEMHHRAQD